MLYPINFSIPSEKILSDLIPGDLTTYIYKTEEYYEEYKKSYFEITKKKRLGLYATL